MLVLVILIQSKEMIGLFYLDFIFFRTLLGQVPSGEKKLTCKINVISLNMVFTDTICHASDKFLFTCISVFVREMCNN